MVKIKNTLGLMGSLKIDVFRCGELDIDLSFHEKNLIVDSGRTSLTKLLSNDGAFNFVSSIGVGTDSTTPTGSDTDLTNRFLKGLTSYDYPTFDEVRFQFIIDTFEANGINIREFGLFSSNGDLFSRIINASPGIDKESDMIINGNWTIKFLVV